MISGFPEPVSWLFFCGTFDTFAGQEERVSLCLLRASDGSNKKVAEMVRKYIEI